MARTIPDIVTMNEVYDYLEIECPYPTGNQSVLLQFIRRRVETAVRRFMRCGITQATYTHYLPQGSPFGDRNNISDGWPSSNGSAQWLVASAALPARWQSRGLFATPP